MQCNTASSASFLRAAAMGRQYDPERRSHPLGALHLYPAAVFGYYHVAHGEVEEGPNGPIKERVQRVADQAGEHKLQTRLVGHNRRGVGEFEHEADVLLLHPFFLRC